MEPGNVIEIHGKSGHDRSTMASQQSQIRLEGKGTPDILLNPDEVVLLDLSQGIRDLGLMGSFFRHKGRLIATNQRAVYFRKKTRDFEIKQLNMRHAGFVSVGYNIQARQLVAGLVFIAGSVPLFASGDLAILGAILALVGLVVVLTARIQGLLLSGSGEKIVFSTKSVPAREISKILTVVSSNS